jgi:plastocyanin
MLFVVGVVGFAGSVGFAGNTGGTAFAASTTVTVGTSLSPKDITVAPGTTVTWTATSGQHKLESTSGPEELKSDDLNAGSSWTHTFTKVGTYAYVDKENENNAALHGTVGIDDAVTVEAVELLVALALGGEGSVTANFDVALYAAGRALVLGR